LSEISEGNDGTITNCELGGYDSSAIIDINASYDNKSGNKQLKSTGMKNQKNNMMNSIDQINNEGHKEK
jgi:hypothetical protein